MAPTSTTPARERFQLPELNTVRVHLEKLLGRYNVMHDPTVCALMMGDSTIPAAALITDPSLKDLQVTPETLLKAAASSSILGVDFEKGAITPELQAKRTTLIIRDLPFDTEPSELRELILSFPSDDNVEAAEIGSTSPKSNRVYCKEFDIGSGGDLGEGGGAVEDRRSQEKQDEALEDKLMSEKFLGAKTDEGSLDSVDEHTTVEGSDVSPADESAPKSCCGATGGNVDEEGVSEGEEGMKKGDEFNGRDEPILELRHDVGCWFVKLNSEEHTQRVALWLRSQKFRGHDIKVAVKSAITIRRGFTAPSGFSSSLGPVAMCGGSGNSFAACPAQRNSLPLSGPCTLAERRSDVYMKSTTCPSSFPDPHLPLYPLGPYTISNTPFMENQYVAGPHSDAYMRECCRQHVPVDQQPPPHEPGSFPTLQLRPGTAPVNAYQPVALPGTQHRDSRAANPVQDDSSFSPSSEQQLFSSTVPPSRRYSMTSQSSLDDSPAIHRFSSSVSMSATLPSRQQFHHQAPPMQPSFPSSGPPHNVCNSCTSASDISRTACDAEHQPQFIRQVDGTCSEPSKGFQAVVPFPLAEVPTTFSSQIPAWHHQPHYGPSATPCPDHPVGYMYCTDQHTHNSADRGVANRSSFSVLGQQGVDSKPMMMADCDCDPTVTSTGGHQQVAHALEMFPPALQVYDAGHIIPPPHTCYATWGMPHQEGHLVCNGVVATGDELGQDRALSTAALAVFEPFPGASGGYDFGPAGMTHRERSSLRRDGRGKRRGGGEWQHDRKHQHNMQTQSHSYSYYNHQQQYRRCHVAADEPLRPLVGDADIDGSGSEHATKISALGERRRGASGARNGRGGPRGMKPTTHVYRANEGPTPRNWRRDAGFGGSDVLHGGRTRDTDGRINGYDKEQNYPNGDSSHLDGVGEGRKRGGTGGRRGAKNGGAGGGDRPFGGAAPRASNSMMARMDSSVEFPPLSEAVATPKPGGARSMRDCVKQGSDKSSDECDHYGGHLTKIHSAPQFNYDDHQDSGGKGANGHRGFPKRFRGRAQREWTLRDHWPEESNKKPIKPSIGLAVSSVSGGGAAKDFSASPSSSPETNPVASVHSQSRPSAAVEGSDATTVPLASAAKTQQRAYRRLNRKKPAASPGVGASADCSIKYMSVCSPALSTVEG